MESWVQSCTLQRGSVAGKKWRMWGVYMRESDLKIALIDFKMAVSARVSQNFIPLVCNFLQPS